MTVPRVVGASAAAVLTVLALAGCTAGAGASSAAAGVSAGAADGAHAAAPTAAASSRDIVRTGELDLSAKDPIGVASRIGALVGGAGGHLDADAEHPGRDASAQLTARIPAAAFDTTLAPIERTGSVRSVTLHAADVTAKVTDDAVRIGALEASIARLKTLLGRASDASDLVSLEGALTSRESDLESLQAEQRGLADQVSYASLQIDVAMPTAAAPAPRLGTFASGFAAGLAALAATGAWLAVAAGVLAPWALVLAVLVGVVAAVRRLVRRRRDGAGPAAHGAG